MNPTKPIQQNGVKQNNRVTSLMNKAKVQKALKI